MTIFHKTFVYLGCILLALTAILHATNITAVAIIANIETAEPFIKIFFEPLWVFPSLNWIIVALIAGYLTLKQNSNSPSIIALLAIIPIADAVVLFAYTGPFIGAFALMVSGCFILAGALIAILKA